MKHLKTYEDLSTDDIKVGDYVIIKSNPKWTFHNSYGIVRKVVKYEEVKEHRYYLIELYSAIFDEMKRASEFLPYFLSTPKKGEMWFVDTYVFKCENKEEFDSLVEEIEMNKKASKFNL